MMLIDNKIPNIRRKITSHDISLNLVLDRKFVDLLFDESLNVAINKISFYFSNEDNYLAEYFKSTSFANEIKQFIYSIQTTDIVKDEILFMLDLVSLHLKVLVFENKFIRNYFYHLTSTYINDIVKYIETTYQTHTSWLSKILRKNKTNDIHLPEILLRTIHLKANVVVLNSNDVVIYSIQNKQLRDFVQFLYDNKLEKYIYEITPIVLTLDNNISLLNKTSFLTKLSTINTYLKEIDLQMLSSDTKEEVLDIVKNIVDEIKSLVTDDDKQIQVLVNILRKQLSRGE